MLGVKVREREVVPLIVTALLLRLTRTVAVPDGFLESRTPMVTLFPSCKVGTVPERIIPAVSETKILVVTSASSGAVHFRLAVTLISSLSMTVVRLILCCCEKLAELIKMDNLSGR